MAGKGTISITFKLDGDNSGLRQLAQNADGLKVALASAVSEAGNLKASLINWSQTVQAFSAIQSSLGMLTGSLASLTADTRAFGGAMAAANTMAGKSGEDFAKLKDQVSELSKEIPIARDELANGLYQVISNGVPEDNWIDYLQASAKASVGGIADLGQAVTVTSTIIKNYGLGWSEAASIQDKLQLTAKNGVTTFEQLAEALPSVAGSASQLGISIDELMAVFATTTGVTGNTAEVSTQLGAVLKSLVKPSSEAAKAAEEMGIKFDAAAVKEAGGLDSFLKALDQSVNDYASKTGKMSETIYGQLFGSVRGLRLLTSLTGEQAQKFTENIEVMKQSAGTMDEAFSTMASTGASTTQMLQNQLAAVMDTASGWLTPILPIANFTSQVGMAAMGVMSMTKCIGPLKNALMFLPVILGQAATAEGRTAIASHGLGGAFKAAAVSGNTLKIAIRGLLITSGIGLAIAAITVLVEHFANAADKATEATQGFDEAAQAYTSAAAQAKVAIAQEAEKLKGLIDKKADCTAAVKHLNAAYGEVFGNHATEKEWYAVLTKCSEAYVKQKGYEAQATLYASKVAEAELSKEAAGERIKELRASGKLMKSVRHSSLQAENGQAEHWTTAEYTDEAKAAFADYNKYDKQQKELSKSASVYTQKMREQSAAIASMVKPTQQTTAATEKLHKAQAGGAAEKKLAMPAELDNLEHINQAIEYQKSLKQKASKDNVASINAELVKLESLKAEYENAGKVSVNIADIPDDQLQSYDQLNQKLQHYTDQLEKATVEERPQIQRHIDDINRIKQGWDDAQAAMSQPADISQLNTIRDLDDAIGYYGQLQKTQSADEIASTQAVIDKLNAKKEVLQLGMELPSMQAEMNEINSLTGKDYKVRVQSIGFDELTEKIRQCNKLLGDMSNPLTDKQRKQVLKLRDGYEQLRASSVDGFGAMRKGWGSIKGIGGGVESITSAIEDNGNAWQTVCGIIDGMLSIYDGITGVIGIINLLTGASKANAVAKGAEAGATVASTAATVANATTAATVVAASIPVIAANKLLAASYIEAATAAFYAAHAYLPFVGFGIATGFAEAAKAQTIAMGATAFAKGGIISGPTLAMVGEYSGAQNNPEVIAPLDKLRAMIKPQQQYGGKVEFEIRGRKLVGVLNKENRLASRT